jgi:hypothetical protein
MLSEYEQNLIKETEGPFLGKRRKWSLIRQPTSMLHGRLLILPHPLPHPLAHLNIAR